MDLISKDVQQLDSGQEEYMPLFAGAVEAKTAYAGLLLDILRTPSATLRDEPLTDKIVSDPARKRVIARNEIRRQLRELVGDDLIA